MNVHAPITARSAAKRATQAHPAITSVGGENTLTAMAHEVDMHENDANTPGLDEILVGVHVDAQDKLLTHMAKIAAHTPAGIMAKVRALRIVTAESMALSEAEEAVLRSLFDDLDRYFAGQ